MNCPILYVNKSTFLVFFSFYLIEYNGDGNLNFKIGDYVTRISYNNDILFRIVSIDKLNIFLKGVDLRLFADASADDLVLAESFNDSSDEKIITDNIRSLNLDRNQFFYLPGRILHIDGDNDYLNRCMKFYDDMGIKANGIVLNEGEISSKIISLLSDYSPDIVVITGHDAFYSKNGDLKKLDSYQNSRCFVDSIKEARKYEKCHDKLIIIAGACQSNYEELIKAGANFASSPRRINIHALDPAIIATSVALSDRNSKIDLLKIIEKTKYGKDGIGGIITNGMMYVGFPR